MTEFLDTCPEKDCAGPAEIENRGVLESTEGYVETIKVRCLHGHVFHGTVIDVVGRDEIG